MGQQVDAGNKQALTLLITISTTFISVLLTFLEITIKWDVGKGGKHWHNYNSTTDLVL